MGKGGKETDTATKVFGACCCIALLLAGGMIAWLAVNSSKGTKDAGKPLLPEECVRRNGTIYGNKCIAVDDTPLLTQDGAEQACRAKGGSLVSISSLDENDAVKNYAASRGLTGDFWIGLYDYYTPSEWIWTEQAQLATYVNWAVNQPAETAALDCTIMSVSDGLWTITNCSSSHQYLCKFNLATPPYSITSVNATAVPSAAGGRAADVVVLRPAYDGGRPILGYSVYSAGVLLQNFSFNDQNRQTLRVTGLIQDMEYNFTATSYNAVGESAQSRSSNVIIAQPTVPGPVGNVNIDAGNSAIVLYFDPPTDDGGRPVLWTSIVVVDQTNNASVGAVNFTENVHFKIVPVSVNDRPVRAFIRCHNVVGAGEVIDIAGITSSALPPAPRGFAVQNGFRSLSFSWDHQAGYNASIVVEALTGAVVNTSQFSSNASASITGLTTDMPYRVSIRYYNSSASGTASGVPAYANCAGETCTPQAVAPAAPTAVNATVIGRQVVLYFDPPANDGDATITYYEVSEPSLQTPSFISRNLTGSLDTTVLTVADLSVSRSYAFQLRAGNKKGPSSPAVFASVTPVPGSPDPPIFTAATAGGRSATLRFLAPANDGVNTPPSVAAILGFNVSSTPEIAPRYTTVAAACGGAVTANTTVCTINVTGLVEGQEYRFFLQTHTGNASALSQPSDYVIPLPVAPVDPVTSVTTTPFPRGVQLSWTAPVDNGGSPVTSYRVIVGGQTNTFTVADANISISPLRVGPTYNFSIVAINDYGNGPASTPVLAAPLPDRPDTPSNVVAEPQDKSVILTFNTPQNNGAPILFFTINGLNQGTNETNSRNFTSSNVQSGHKQTFTFGGLPNDKKFTFTVTATNIMGTSGASSPTQTVIPGSQALVEGWAIAVAATILTVTIVGATAAGVYWAWVEKVGCFSNSGTTSKMTELS